LQDLEVSYRPIELRSLIDRAYQERRSVTVREVERPVSDQDVQYLEVQVTPLLENSGEPLGASITFVDVTSYHGVQEELERTKHDLETSNEELQSTNEELQSTNEELETTNEELQSSVEELQTTNEELQSTNEEMETMNEELQSTNAQLEAINNELRSRTEEVNELNAFLESVLASVRFGVLVVDRDLQVLLWNEKAEDLWGLRQDEAVGQSLMKLDIGLPVKDLEEPVRAVLNGEFKEDLVLGATNRKGKSIRCRVTCRVRLGPEGNQQGVVLMMEEEPK
jgi:two-component system CheB/CheR fusion protein